MLSAIRRYVVILAVGLWLGGFTFYAAVVVPTGADVLGSSEAQGFVTREVTRHLNEIGIAALAILLWNAIVERGKLLFATWLGMQLAQLALLLIHPRLDAMLNPVTHDIAPDFHLVHEVYLWIAATQWGLGLVHVWCLLDGWYRPARAKIAAQAGTGEQVLV
jgi:hypothetical protein